MKKLIFFCLINVIFLPMFSVATGIRDHKKVVRGTVKNSSGYPISGARIVINGIATRTFTDESGYYKIRIKGSTATIGVVAFGGGILIDSVRNRDEINFVFSQFIAVRPPDDISALKSPIYMGYGSLRSGNVNYATRFLDPRKSKRHYSSIDEMISELIGFSGGPLTMSRGGEPMIIVNGLPATNLDDIQPDLVESITYLKDGAAAIYGSRAFGGVILIKTSTNLMDR